MTPYPNKVSSAPRDPSQKLNLCIRSSNKSFAENSWRQLCIAEHFFAKHKDLLHEVYLFNVPTNKCAIDMYENLEIFKQKKLRTFIDFESAQIVQHFNLQSFRSVYLMNAVADAFDPLALYSLQNQIGVVHSSEQLKNLALGKFYETHDIEGATTLLKTYLNADLGEQQKVANEYCKKLSNTLDVTSFASQTTVKSVVSATYNPRDISKPLLIGYDNSLSKHENCRAFVDTLDKNDWEYAIISISDEWKGFTDKLLGYKLFLDTLPDDKIVVLSDTRDVFCCRASKHFLQGFKSKKSDFIACMEILCGGKTEADKPRGNCVPLTAYWKHTHREYKPLRKFVNSGLISGKVSTIKKFFAWAVKEEYTDDQVALGWYMNDFPKEVYADDTAELFHTSLFAHQGGLLDPVTQKQDSPTFAELCGRSAFFLHLPACAPSAQNVMSKYVKTILDMGSSAKTIHPKDFPEVDYDGNFVNGSKLIIK
jgi:hypothetical protein